MNRRIKLLIIGVLFVAIALSGCRKEAPPPTEPPDVEFRLRATAIDHSDGIPPDTMAFLLRVDGESDSVRWAVIGSHHAAGFTTRQQLQIAFTYEGAPTLTLLAWAWHESLSDSVTLTWRPDA